MPRVNDLLDSIERHIRRVLEAPVPPASTMDALFKLSEYRGTLLTECLVLVDAARQELPVSPTVPEDPNQPACVACGCQRFDLIQGPVPHTGPDGQAITLIVAQTYCARPECRAIQSRQIMGMMMPQPGPESDINPAGKKKVWSPS
jgi:hypothetical protein